MQNKNVLSVSVAAKSQHGQVEIDVWGKAPSPPNPRLLVSGESEARKKLPSAAFNQLQQRSLFLPPPPKSGEGCERQGGLADQGETGELKDQLRRCEGKPEEEEEEDCSCPDPK